MTLEKCVSQKERKERKESSRKERWKNSALPAVFQPLFMIECIGSAYCNSIKKKGDRTGM